MATTTNDRAKKVNGRRCERIEKKGFDELMEEEKGTESETEENLPVAPEANPRSLSPCLSLVVTRAKPNGVSISPAHSDNQEFKLGIQGLELFNGSELYQGPGVFAANHDSAVT
ncbi:hypothetical protein BofuT4_P093280.1 [Botrytis cinerea T4]|uniref:Uncharacterized protein n=1 Tax=Botryotinia fuckeliana (strain T4) TaxID=999810 RepID=G2YE58_BOTF4|nr:hypothetical protein BofuT4_P093280.1 [Botrytis cinerea T4]